MSVLRPPAQRWQLSQRGATALLAATLITFLAASSAPTPLYRLYQSSWGFSPATLTVVFAVYALSLLAALLTVGALSDHVGRRPVILGALVVEAAAMGLFAGAEGVPALIVARVLQGFATGAATGALGAAVLDTARARGPLVNSVAPIAGMAIGALGAALLVQFLPAPRQTVYLVLLAAFALQAIGVALVRETAGRRPGVLASLRPHVAVPPAARPALAAVTPLDVAVWALGGFYLSLGPSLVRSVTGSDSVLQGGLLVFALTAAGAVAVVAMRATPADTVMRRGAAALAAGLAVTLVGAHAGSAPVLFAGTLVAGIGFGAGFQGALRTVLPLAGPGERAGLAAAFYVISYLAMSVPAVAAGIAAATAGLLATATGYGLVVIVLALSVFTTRREETRA